MKPDQSRVDQDTMGIDPVVAMVVGFEPNNCLSLICFCAHPSMPVRFFWTVEQNTNPSGFDEGKWSEYQEGFQPA